MLLVFQTQTLLRVDCVKAQLPHQPPDAIATCRLALLLQVVSHPPGAAERMTRVLLVDHSHLSQVTLARRLRRVVVTRSRKAQKFTLPGDRQLRATRFDHLPLLVTALQLFFSTSPTRTEVDRSADRVLPRALRHLCLVAADHQKGSRSYPRSPVSSRLPPGWGAPSNRPANSASVPSPRIAAKATFALNAGVNFRRFLAMNSPPTALVGP